MLPLDWVLWQKTTYYRQSDFRIEEQSESRIVLRARKYGLLAVGVFFVLQGLAVAWLGIVKAAHDTAALLMILAFAALCSLFGVAAIWASRTQKDTIVVDRNLGTVRSERAKTRRKAGDPPFAIQERLLEKLECVRFRVMGGSAWLSFHFRDHGDIDIDSATKVEHLKGLGQALAAVAGVELREQ